MRNFLESFLRASLYCLYPRILALTLLPVLILGGSGFAFAYFFGTQSVALMQEWLQSSGAYTTAVTWLHTVGWEYAGSVLPPVIFTALLSPLVLLLSLLFVEIIITPKVNQYVAQKRFPLLVREHETGWFSGIAWILSSYCIAILFLLISLPLWLIPPLAVLLPSVIWGWLLYRVMVFDVLSGFASKTERKIIIKQHSPWIIAIGISIGFLSSLPLLGSILSVFFAVFFVFFIPLAVWIYAFTFTFATLWFSHFCLQSLHQMRTENTHTPAAVETVVQAGDTDDKTGHQAPAATDQNNPNHLPPGAIL